MPVATLLLKPDSIRRAIDEDPDRALMQDVVSLVGRILVDRIQGGRLSAVMQAAGMATAGRIRDRAGDGFERAGERLLTLVDPLLQGLSGGDGGLPEEEPAEQVSFVLNLISQAAGSIQELEVGNLRGPVGEIFSILEDELGLTPDFLEGLVLGLLDDLASGLSGLGADSEGEERGNAQGMEMLVRRVRGRVQGRLELPALDADRAASAFMRLLRKLDVERVMRAASHSTDALAELAEAVDAVLELVPFSGQGTHGVGADEVNGEGGERQYCWYLSWLLGDRYEHRHGGSIALDVVFKLLHLTPFPADEVWAVDGERDFVRRYLFHREQRLFNAGFVTTGEADSLSHLFEFDTAATAASSAAQAAAEAARHTSEVAARFAVGDATEDEFSQAREAAEKALKGAQDYLDDTRDEAKEADKAAAEATSRCGRARAATERAAAGAMDSANAAAQIAFQRWDDADLPRDQSGRVAFADASSAADDLLQRSLDSAQAAGSAAEAVAEAYNRANLAAGEIAAAVTQAEAVPSAVPSAAAEGAEQIALAAREAAEAATRAWEHATDALLAADAALESAVLATGRGEAAEQAVEAAEEALESALDSTEVPAVVGAYEATLGAVEQAVDAVEDAASAVKEASDAALLARAAAAALITRPRYSFTHVDPQAMEKWAFHSAYAADLLEMLMHGLSHEDGDFLSNLLLTLGTGTHAVYKGVRRRPFPQWVEWLIRLLSPIIGSFPYMHTNATAGNGMIFWLTYYGARALEAHIYYFFAQSLRSALLSLLTLINHDRSQEENRPLNYKALEGTAQLITAPFIFLWAALTPKEHYNIQQPRLWWLDWAIGGLVYASTSATLGYLLGIAICRDWHIGAGPGTALWGNQVWKTAILSYVGFWPALFLVHENDTNDGTFNPDLDWPGGVLAPHPWIQGYPPRDTSPYLLPFRGGPLQCVQGNQGIWSHNADRVQPRTGPHDVPQVYAYDFGHDYGDDILASRGGTVVDFFDWAPDNENTNTPAPVGAGLVPGQTATRNWNFVCIRHDDDPAGAPMNNFAAGHDPTNPIAGGRAIDPNNGNPVFTYAVYGHGRQGSVRAAFQANNPGIPATPANMIGRRIGQGEVIMRANDTGISAYNHLHMHVRTSSQIPPPPPPPGIPPVATGTNSLDPGTIPFVYRDAVHRDLYHAASDDGIPRSLKFYRSSQ
jgi:hypothetical protein